MSEPIVQHVSREELERRKAELLGLLEVFLTYSQAQIEQELAEVRYLLGEVTPDA